MEKGKGLTGKHSPGRLLLILTNAAVTIMMVAINYISSTKVSDWFVSSTRNVTDRNPSAIRPAGWTFSLWGAIYAWQLLLVLYTFSLIFRKNRDGSYLYVNPEHIHVSFYIVYMIKNCLNIGWVFAYDRALLEVSFSFQVVGVIALYICMVILCKYLNNAGEYLESLGNKKEVWLARFTTINGVAFYAGWSTLAMAIGLSTTLSRAGVNMYASAWIALVLVTTELLAWFILENVIFDRYLRYCFTPYIAVIVGFSGILYQNFELSSPAPHMIYTLAVLVLTCIFAAVKLLVMIIKGIRKPIDYVDVDYSQ